MGCSSSTNSIQPAPKNAASPRAADKSNNATNEGAVNINIDNYLEEALTTGCKVSTIKSILVDKDSRQAFLSFLKSELKDSDLQFFIEIEKLKRFDTIDVAKKAQDLVEGFLKPGSANNVNISDQMKKNITDQLSGASSDTQKNEIITSIQSVQNEVITIMAMGAFPRFLRSPQYTEWREKQNEVQTRPNQAVVSTAPAAPTSTLMERAVESIDAQERTALAGSESWLNALFSASESLPICISLATARKDRRGFPLIYVNACFEKTTGYPRSEIVGKNCKFLQNNKGLGISEPESIQRLSDALRDAKPVKVVITNFKRDGTPFKNLLAMKPIYDDKGEYRYVVGVQFDVSEDNATPARLRMADILLNSIPNVIFSLDNE